MDRKRERANTQHRYEEYQARQEEKAAAADRRRRIAVAAGAGGAAVALVATVALWIGGRDDDASIAGDAGDGAATTPADATALPASTAPPADDPGLCPEPGPGPRTDPVQLQAVPPAATGPLTVTLDTTCGPLTAELDGAAAPLAVGNLVGLAQAGFYDGTPCHRLTTEGIFVLQCGDPTATGTGGPGYTFGPVENAPADDVYPAGTLAMARVGGDAQSMGSQFFVVYQDSTIPADAAGGYTVLGTLTSGLDVVQRIASAGTAADGVAPAQSVGIRSLTVQEAQ
ncbi:MAG: peptidylprolyl isomerase [Kineosporiaceae bacterium]